MSDDVMIKESLAAITASDVHPGQHYKHYKTGTVYLVIAVGLHEADLEPLVHYRDAADEYGIVWTRYLNIFCGKALVKDAFVRRFERVD